MRERTIIIGLDVHKDTIAVARASRHGGPPESLGTIVNSPQAIARLMRKLGAAEEIAVCYEAGPCGYAIYHQLTTMKIACQVVAPSMIPRAPGERVKTDRRDAEKLARLYRSGDLHPVWVPDAAHEALRDLVRMREQSRQDLQRARGRLSKWLLRLDLRPPTATRAWSTGYYRWLATLQREHPPQQLVLAELIEQEALAVRRHRRLDAEIVQQMQSSPLAPLWRAWQVLKGVGTVTASTLIAELGDCSRFEHPRQLMAYGGVTPGEYSSGARTRRGAITKHGNTAIRRVMIEAAWHYALPPKVGAPLRRRQAGQPETITAIAWTAQKRLNPRFHRLVRRGKSRPQAAVAIARELMGPIWEIAQTVRLTQLAN
ncbi:MAG: IS110 family transposase [Thermomicrobiales bacterium]|nr:IS110 family transposase [Thermomicrobiales bacterium]